MAGKGPDDGGDTGMVRNPDKYCKAKRSDGSPCAAYALINSDVCRVHGGSSPGAVDARARAEIAQSVGMLGLPVPVDVEDFPEVAGQYVGLLNQIIAGLLADLRQRQQDSTDVTMARDYADILDRINATTKLTAQMMEAVARLRAATPKKPKVEMPPSEVLSAALDQVRDRLIANSILVPAKTASCWKCGAPPAPPKPEVLDGNDGPGDLL